MTDLATQPQAGEASGDDAVEAEQAVENVESATADTTESKAVNETDAEAPAETETAESVAPAGEQDSPGDEAEAEPGAEPADEIEPAAEPADQTVSAGDADVEAEAEPADEAADENEPVDEAEPAEEPAAEAEPADEAEPVDETDATPATETDAAPQLEEPAAEAGPGASVDEGHDTGAVATAVLTPGAESAATPTTDLSGAAAAVATATAPADGSPTYAWAPAEPKPKKRHTAIWVSAVAGAAVVGLVVSSLVLIAPGTAVAGVPVGWLTPGAAADAIEQRLAETTVVLTGSGEDAEVTGAELGAAVDAKALADAAFSQHPMWNPTAWFATTDAEIELDPGTATAALREVAPQLYTDPTDATLAFDAATATYVATPAVPGTGIDVGTVQAAIQAAFEAGQTRVQLDPVAAEVPADISTETADATVAQLNGMLDTAGFYVGDERTVPIDRAVAASWLTVAPRGDAFAITADAAAIQPLVDTLAGAVDRAPENSIVITDTAGKVLQTEAAGQSGRQLGDTAGLAAAFATQLGSGDAVYKLPVAEVPVSTTTLARNIVVDLSDQRAYFYENGAVVSSTAMSSGLPGHDTTPGSFRITAKLRSQNMGNPDLTKPPNYYTKNVPWVMYFNGDQALHGAYWHNNFGHRMSHGCVNLPVDVAAFLYQWAPMGTEVRVQA